MKWKHLPIVAFDTETTGLDPYVGDRIIEVGLVVLQLDNAGNVISRDDFSHLVNPGMPIPKKITQITGIRDEDVQGQPSFEELAEEIGKRFQGAIAVAHNYPFDAAFFTVEFAKAGVLWQEPLAAVDTVDLSMKLYPDVRGHKLGDVTKRLGVSLENAHRATDDAAACGYCFAEMVKRNEVEDDLQILLDWANAIGRPPEGPITVDRCGIPVFADGPHEGMPVMEEPLHLSWMEKARERHEGRWRYRYPESTRRWIRRYLNVRAAGRARQNPKSFRSSDWVLDPCIAVDRRQSL